MIRLDALPAAQRVLWSDALPSVARTWVLYGDTAIALHLGHRQSVDFDFFSSDPLDRDALRHACSFLEGAPTLQDEPDTLTVALDVAGEPIKLSFFGGIPFGRVGEPLRSPAHPPIASLLDLLGTKLATVTQRIEARDYVDIAALLRSGLTLDQGVAAMLALYGTQASALQSAQKQSELIRKGVDLLIDRALHEDADWRQVTRAAAGIWKDRRDLDRRSREFRATTKRRLASLYERT